MRKLSQALNATFLAAAVTGLAALSEAAATAGSAAAPSPEVMAQGEALYLKNCRMCHGSRGTAGKPLKANEALADADHVASAILLGPGYMTSFAEHLSDEEIALITTFVRNSWGNAYGAVAREDVARLR